VHAMNIHGWSGGIVELIRNLGTSWGEWYLMPRTSDERNPSTNSEAGWVSKAGLDALQKENNLLSLAETRGIEACATNRKVAGSITDGVIGIFH
jgi:hypothetical protein